MADPDYVENDLGVYEVNVAKYEWASNLDWYFADATDCASFAGTVDALEDVPTILETVSAVQDAVYGGHRGTYPSQPK